MQKTGYQVLSKRKTVPGAGECGGRGGMGVPIVMGGTLLGLEHTGTLTGMVNLAWTFWTLDMKKEAI